MADEIKATPRNALLGLLADALTAADEYTQRRAPTGGLLNPPLNALSGLLGVPGAARTVDRLSYGEPITNIGKGSYKPMIPQDTVDAAGLLAMVAPAASKGAMKASDAAVRAITGNKQANSVNVLAQASKLAPLSRVSEMSATYKGGKAAGEYQISHRPMTIEGGAAPLHDLAPVFGDDIFSSKALQYFGSGDPREAAVLRLMRQVRGNPDASVTIYRGVPDGVEKINPGDWVTLSPEAAADYGNVLSMKVPASHVTSWPDSLLEFGYYPPK